MRIFEYIFLLRVYWVVGVVIKYFYEGGFTSFKYLNNA